MITFNARRIKLILLLLEESVPLKVKDVAQIMECSERMLRYDLDSIDTWLTQHAFPNLTRKPKVGISLLVSEQQKQAIIRKVKLIPARQYEFSQDERFHLILLHFFTQKQGLTVKYFQQLLLHSRGTILNDLESVASWLDNYNLTLERKPKYGLSVKGKERNIRQAFAALIQQIEPSTLNLLENNLIDLQEEPNPTVKHLPAIFHRLQIISDMVKPILKWTKIFLSDTGINNLVAHIAMSLERVPCTTIDFQTSELEKLRLNREFRVAQLITLQLEKKFTLKIPEQETAYITLHLLGNQYSPSMLNRQQNDQHKLIEVIRHMTVMVESKMRTRFTNREEIIKGLLLHLGPALYRAKFGLVTDNPLLEQIKTEYPKLYEVTHKSLAWAGTELGVDFSDEEVAYVAMHYGSALIKGQVQEEHLVEIIVVCSSGLGTANMLKARLSALFTNIRIVQTYSYQSILEETSLTADLVVSTIPLPNLGLPILVVHPLLEEVDYERLTHYLTPKLIKQTSAYYLYEQIWPIIEKYTQIQDQQLLTNELLVKIQTVIEGKRTWTPLSVHTLENLLTEERLQVGQVAESWQEAIYLSVSPLEKEGIVSARYKERIIDILQERGPYMAISKGILLAHASPADGVYHLGMSLTTFHSGIAFGHPTNDPIQLICVLATPDKESHVHALNQLLELLANEEEKLAIFKATDIWQVKRIIRQFSKKIGW